MDNTLAELNILDPETGQLITADDVFMDWAATLYLMDGSVGDGRYDYNNYPDAPQVTARNPSQTAHNLQAVRSINMALIITAIDLRR